MSGMRKIKERAKNEFVYFRAQEKNYSAGEVALHSAELS